MPHCALAVLVAAVVVAACAAAPLQVQLGSASAAAGPAASGNPHHREHLIAELQRKGLLPKAHAAQSQATLSVSPTTIGGNGGLVTLTWSDVQFPTYDNWVGLWCGAAPGVDVAPIKYIRTGYNASGNATFWIPNFHMTAPSTAADPSTGTCSFGAVTGGAQYPLIIGVSNTVSFSEPDYPTGVHTAIVNDTAVRISWQTMTANQALFLSTKPNDPSPAVIPADMIAYSRSDMCDQPAATTAWMDPGALNSAVFAVGDATTYYYRVGDTKKQLLSDEFTFHVPRKAGDTTPMVLYAFGDMGNTPLDPDVQQHSWDNDNHGEIAAAVTVKSMAALVDQDDPEFILHIGDIAYAVGYLAEWPSFMHQIEPVAASRVWMTGIGNHEIGNPNSFVPGEDSGGECGVPYSSLFRMPAPADTGKAASPWYWFRSGLVHVIVMSTEHDSSPGSPQHAWLTQAFAQIDRKLTPFVIFAGHRPMYIDSNWNGTAYSDQGYAASLRQWVEPFLLANKVDLAIWGHHHSFQATCRVSNTTCTPAPAGPGTVHIVLGMAGYELSKNLEVDLPPYMVYANAEHWGFVRMSVTSSMLEAQFLANDGDHNKPMYTVSIPAQSF